MIRQTVCTTLRHPIRGLPLLLLEMGLAIKAADAAEERAGTPIAGIDHVTVAVRDLESTVQVYRQLGFTLKPGRLHQNGLRNQHIKFPDGSGLELISPPGKANDCK